MQINKFTKLKSGQYKLSLENGTSLVLHEDLILKNNILLTKKIEDDLSEKLLEENVNYIAYDLALKYIGIKMRSVLELKEYLKKKEVKEEIIDKTIELLLEQGYLNNGSYVQAYINDKINLSNDGPYKIKEALLKSGISENEIDSSMNAFDNEFEITRITKLIDKQQKKNHKKSNMILKKNLIDYLVNLGYTKELVIKEVNKIQSDDTSIAKKEYEKQKEKLSKKYEGKELEYKLRQKMYQKGFSNYDE